MTWSGNGTPCAATSAWYFRTRPWTTYIVDPMRSAVFAHLSVSPLAVHALSPGVTWFGWVVPLGLSLALVAFMGAAMLAIAIAEFRKTE